VQSKISKNKALSSKEE